MILDLSKYDFQLLEVSSELYALEDHLKLIEDQMMHIQKNERHRLDSYIHTNKLSYDDFEWQYSTYEVTNRIEFLLPRIFRGSFLVALYAVYESAVIEIAGLIQRKQFQGISIKDLKGNFLEQAKEYYKHILKFELYIENEAWQRVKMLSELRNAFAHANGRIEMLNQKSKNIIKSWERQKAGITTYSGYIVCDAKIVSDIFQAVRVSLEDLVDRYKKWNVNQVNAAPKSQNG